MHRCFACRLAVAAGALLFAAQVWAQEGAWDLPPPADQAESAYATATPADVEAASEDQPAAESEIASRTADAAPVCVDDAAFAAMLNGAPMETGAAKALRLLRAGTDTDAKWSRNDNRDGSASIAVNKPLATPWDTKVGAEAALAAPPVTVLEPGGRPFGAGDGRRLGAAWANVAVPAFATVGLRADPAADRAKFGGTLERAMPLGKNFSLSVQGSVGYTEVFTTAGAAPAASVWDSEKSARLNVLATGTTFAAGLVNSTVDPLTHSKLSAEQKIWGPLNVAGAIKDAGQPTSSKSLTAGLKFSW